MTIEAAIKTYSTPSRARKDMPSNGKNEIINGIVKQ
jgi:hypothetical protein